MYRCSRCVVHVARAPHAGSGRRETQQAGHVGDSACRSRHDLQSSGIAFLYVKRLARSSARGQEVARNGASTCFTKAGAKVYVAGPERITLLPFPWFSKHLSTEHHQDSEGIESAR
eukprot:CAMPEP_0114263448 /NCGR_PEP_ID=MMETSP0058-20121206/22517_1 /TAXON_ID=36894 /ORGANISM="Pyramimonas parkeae, CCMP726" /LENGTH=115 /DNA_ID=CAMNT_0001379733 /DNA_START=163 /DNA_END=510 /DNA_ORIENTATION=+